MFPTHGPLGWGMAFFLIGITARADSRRSGVGLAPRPQAASASCACASCRSGSIYIYSRGCAGHFKTPATTWWDPTAQRRPLGARACIFPHDKRPGNRRGALHAACRPQVHARGASGLQAQEASNPYTPYGLNTLQIRRPWSPGGARSPNEARAPDRCLPAPLAARRR
jgi:hypothetical protein